MKIKEQATAIEAELLIRGEKVIIENAQLFCIHTDMKGSNVITAVMLSPKPQYFAMLRLHEGRALKAEVMGGETYGKYPQSQVHHVLGNESYLTLEEARLRLIELSE